MKRKILTVIATLILTVGGLWTLTGCGDSLLYVKIQETEYFTYYVWDNEVTITGLTEKGKQQKTLAIPAEIDNIAVTALQGKPKFYFQGGADFESEKLEKLFIPKFEIYVGAKFNQDVLKKYIFIDVNKDSVFSSDRFSTSEEYSYTSKEAYEYLKDRRRISPANTTFYFNYETDINYGCYWIDDIDYGNLIEYIPERPKRENYEFKGWYKEIECRNEWEFGSDTVEQETNLYAKWL